MLLVGPLDGSCPGGVGLADLGSANVLALAIRLSRRAAEQTMTGLLSSMMSPLCLPVQGSEQSRPPPPHIGGYLPWDPVPVRTGSSAVDTPLGYFLLLLLGLVIVSRQLAVRNIDAADGAVIAPVESNGVRC